MTTDEIKKTSKLISLVDVKAKKEESTMATEEEDMLTKGKETFQEMMDEGAVGFIALTFDANSDPRILWSGDIDLVKALGSLELAKKEIADKIYSYTE